MRLGLRSILFATLLLVILSVSPGAQRGGGAAPPRGQPSGAATGTASIVGTVSVNEPNGQPLRRVTISITNRASGGIAQQQTTTDDQGRFAFLNLPAGTYSAPRAAKGSYVASAFGEKRPDGVGTPITLAEGQRLTIAFKMFRGAVITGSLTDNGRPLVATQVSASPVRIVNGVRSSAGMRAMIAQTDDRGMFRIYGLAPGEYVVAATPRLAMSGEIRPVTDAEIRWAERQIQGVATGAGAAPQGTAPAPAQPVAFSTVYYPGTTHVMAAATVSVTAGQERSSVDFSVSYVPTAKIDGVILDPDGQPAQTAQVNLVPMQDSSEMLVSDTSFMLDTMLLARPVVVAGKFTMAGVRPGRYTLAARAAPAGAQQATAPGPGRGGPPPALTQWATTEVTINGEDQTGLVLRLQPGLTLTGRFVFDATTLQPPADLTRLSVRLTPAATGAITVSVNPPVSIPSADGTFRIEGASPGRYQVTSFVPGAPTASGPSWVLRSARVGSVDAADTPFELRAGEAVPEIVMTFTDRAAELSGTVLDATGKPTPSLSIMLFTTDRSMWGRNSRRVRPPVRADTSGKFRFASLMPGEYFLVALGDFDQADVMKPEFLEQVAAAALKITIAEGEKKIQDLKISGS